MKKLIYLILIISCAACSKQNATYYDFIRGGAITYTGKADSVKAFGGRDRMLLSWLLTSDQNIRYCKVFWNFGGDSLTLPVVKTAWTDTIRTYIDHLPEGTYNFTVYTYDSVGHHSVGSQAIGNAYGEIFMSTLHNKPVRALTKTGNTLTVIWVGKDAKCLGTQWNFTGTDAQAHTYVAPQRDTTIITGVDMKSPVSYRSLFVPEANAIDTFYTDYKTL